MEIKITLPTIEQVAFITEAFPQTIPEIVFGDPEFDAKVKNDIAEQIQSNIWTWCTVKVAATWKSLEGTDYLGCCSYESEGSFMKDTIYPEMKERAYNNLISRLKDLGDKQ